MVHCSKMYTGLETKFGNVFARYGRFVARHPWKFIIFGILVNGLLGIGMVTLEEDIRIVNVYSPIDSQTSKNMKILKDGLFPDLSGSKFYAKHKVDPGDPQVWLMAYAVDGNILNQGFLEEVERLYKHVVNISITHGGEVVPFTEICAVLNSDCAVRGDVFFSKDFISAVNSDHVSFPLFFHSTRGPMYYRNLVASPVVDDSGTRLLSSSGVFLDFSLRTDTPDHVTLSREWEYEFLEQIQHFTSSDLDIAYSHSRSLDEELDHNVKGDIMLFALTIAIMLGYACVATYTARHDWVGQRMLLGLAGVSAAGLALVSAFGIVSACGVQFVSIVGVLPFLLIGIGVDDMFILMSGITHAPYDLSVEDRVGEMMRTSGVAITITSLTNILAFAAGASSIFRAVRNFCIYTGVAIVICYFNQATIFVGSITVNEKRVASCRHAFTFRQTKPRQELETVGKSAGYVFCCAGSPPRSAREAESWLDRFPQFLFPKLVSPRPMKIAILLLFAGYLAVSVWGITLMEEGIYNSQLVKDASYAKKFYKHFEDDFTEVSVSFVIDEPLTYSDPETQQQVGDLIKRAKANPYIKDDIAIDWLTDYKKSQFYAGSNESAFIEGLQSFVSRPENARYENDVKLDPTRSTITASRFYVLSNTSGSSTENAELLTNTMNIARDSPFSVFVYSPEFHIFESYEAILGQTLQTLVIAVAMVFFVTILFMPHPRSLVLIVITVSMITAGIFGFIAHLDLTLSAITMIQIIMSIGFSVEFTAHIIHGYVIARRPTRGEKVTAALIHDGTPIFHGAASSFLGVILLSTAESYIFKTFFKMMSLVIGFGIAHALLFLPVVLSVIGPLINTSGGDEDDDRGSPRVKPSVESGSSDRIVDKDWKRDGANHTVFDDGKLGNSKYPDGNGERRQHEQYTRSQPMANGEISSHGNRYLHMPGPYNQMLQHKIRREHLHHPRLQMCRPQYINHSYRLEDEMLHSLDFPGRQLGDPEPSNPYSQQWDDERLCHGGSSTVLVNGEHGTDNPRTRRDGEVCHHDYAPEDREGPRFPSETQASNPYIIYNGIHTRYWWS